MLNKDAKTLLNKYREGTATEDEINQLLNWVQQLEGDIQVDLTVEDLKSAEFEMWRHLSSFIEKPKIIKLWPKIVAAASILLFLSVGGYFILHKSTNKQTAQNQFHDVAPGGNKATLTLANGSKIILNDSKNGLLANQGNANVIKLANGQLFYNKTKADVSEVLYNTMTIPRGGKYDLTLADGTKVWLNAESSITYPVTFTGKYREVNITGEAYFEVTKNKHLPFLVKSGGQTVEVLGTHFNINAYADEGSIKTTLLEGSIKVTSAKGGSIIKPGEQAEFKNDVFSISNVDAEGAIAWKNGFFHYNKADIKTIMRSFARWYDVKIEYEGKVPDKEFSGDIHREVSAAKALKILSYLNIDFKIEGEKIIVTNKKNSTN